MKSKFCSNFADHFAGVGKMVAGGLLDDKSNNAE